jgi:hypothetical protein
VTRAEVHRLIEDLFQEEALVLGGLVEIHNVGDAFVEQLFRSLTRVREHALERIGWIPDAGPPQPGRQEARRRPAIEQFLSELHRPITSTNRG